MPSIAGQIGKDDARAVEMLEIHYRPDSAFDSSMVALIWISALRDVALGRREYVLRVKTAIAAPFAGVCLVAGAEYLFEYT
ncbi:hypothetical protein [Paraburkholderia diazotrophica]|uniref:hypothetical protein n=1 Tax=Paraburkholderia diazotrophica TaxID=667676 RepID=UPI0031805EA0